MSDIGPQKPIMNWLQHMDADKFSHYIVAKAFASQAESYNLSDGTLDNFEALFREVNKIF